MQDTIVAIATSLQTQAISIIRLSGIDALSIASKLFTKDLTKVESHTIHYGYIKHAGITYDEVLVSVFKAPKTFTKEDVVEINCHGGIFITQQILNLCLEQGARLARKGEFSERAFLNGRIDLTQAESVLDMIDATYEAESELALQGIKGHIKDRIEQLKNDLVDVIANIEVNIDYPEYDDVTVLTTTQVAPMTLKLIEQISTLIEDAKQGQLIKDGVKTVILGKPNVGKSSLLNALLEEDKAIVTPIAGTTRDIVEGSILIGGVKLNLIDTAGIHETDDLIEQMGIKKSKDLIEAADLVLLVLDVSKPLTKEDQLLLQLTEEKQRFIMLNKKDLNPVFEYEGIMISAKENKIEPLIDAIKQNFMIKSDKIRTNVLISNQRHITLLKRALASLNDAYQSMQNEFALDFVIVDLNEAYYRIKEILGEASKLNLLDEIFSRFCLGK